MKLLKKWEFFGGPLMMILIAVSYYLDPSIKPDENISLLSYAHNVIIGFVYFVAAFMFFHAIYSLISATHYNKFEKLLVISTIIVFLIPTIFSVIYKKIQTLTSCIKNIENSIDTLYFSYTTFTTLGYGDLQPVGVCRFVSSIQAVTGYLSLGFLTAILIIILTKNNELEKTEPKKHKPYQPPTPYSKTHN